MSTKVTRIVRPSRAKNDAELDITSSEALKLGLRGYTLKKKLSQGFSAKIYLASYKVKQEEHERVMACKVVDKSTGDPKFLKKFLPREMEILSQVSNRHCIEVYTILEIRTKCFIFMRYAENGDLLDYLSKNGPTEETHARMWIRQMMLALQYLHSLNIAHRDIKCENILITSNLNAKLADFGFARSWADEKGREAYSETYCGSISYAAPEILAGRPYIPKFCDMWSMGVVFFIMVNMTKPFNKNKAGPLLQLQLAKDYTFRPKVERTMSPEGKDIIRNMLEPDVSLRATPQSVLDSDWMKADPYLIQLVPE